MFELLQKNIDIKTITFLLFFSQIFEYSKRLRYFFVHYLLLF